MSERSEADERRLVYKLMSDALIEIRTVAFEGKGHKGIFKIADLFHNIPLNLERLERKGDSYTELLDGLRTHADRNGTRPWLDNAIERIERAETLSSNAKVVHKD